MEQRRVDKATLWTCSRVFFPVDDVVQPKIDDHSTRRAAAVVTDGAGSLTAVTMTSHERKVSLCLELLSLTIIEYFPPLPILVVIIYDKVEFKGR